MMFFFNSKETVGCSKMGVLMSVACYINVTLLVDTEQELVCSNDERTELNLPDASGCMTCHSQYINLCNSGKQRMIL
jgi:hypothetical protein